MCVTVAPISPLTTQDIAGHGFSVGHGLSSLMETIFVEVPAEVPLGFSFVLVVWLFLGGLVSVCVLVWLVFVWSGLGVVVVLGCSGLGLSLL